MTKNKYLQLINNTKQMVKQIKAAGYKADYLEIKEHIFSCYKWEMTNHYKLNTY